jgi:integrase/recombinase XerD
MARVKTPQMKPLPGDPNDPNGMHVWTQRFLKALAVKGQSPQTVDTRRLRLGAFIEWCGTRSITTPMQVTKPVIEAYQRHLFHRRLPNGKPLSFGTQHGSLVAVKRLFQWLTKSNVLLFNPASEIELPRLGRRLPRHVLTAAEVESVLAVPDVNDPLGLRDRAILETLYSTGIRRSELVKLHVFDVDVERGTILVREGKRSNDRVVPIGERALAWIEKYQREVRQQILTDPNNTVLFVSRLGDGLTAGHLTDIVRRQVKAANIGKTGSCHLFRHAMATLMLERGADVRMVQAMLGHASLNTTALYTHVAIRALKEVHERTHPGAKLGKPDPKTGTTSPEAEALLATLAAEADGDHE